MIRFFHRDERGTTAVAFAASLTPLLLAVGLVVDMNGVTNNADQLQNSLDSAAVVVASRYQPTSNMNKLKTMGQDFLMANMAGTDGVNGDFSVSARKVDEEYEVTVTNSMVHTGMVGNRKWPIERSSTAKILPGAPACMLSLSETADRAVEIQGSSTVSMQGCVIGSNSTSPTSIYRGGAGTLEADCIMTSGGTSGIVGSSNVKMECAELRENQYPFLDPLYGLTAPAYTACLNVPNKKEKTLSPGTYCNKTISGQVELQPGNYILRGGKIDLGGNGSIKGEGVTIFLMEDAELSLGANQTVQLSAPTSGPYEGILIFQPSSNTTTIKINGTNDSVVTGFIYAPGARIDYTGNASASTDGGCVRLIGETLELNGNANFRTDCGDKLGERDMTAGRLVTLVK